MIHISGTIRLPADGINRARPAMLAMLLASRAEPGCLLYCYAQDLLDPGLFHVVEQWRDRAALAAHFASPHLLAWRAQFATLGIHDRRLSLLEGEPEPI